MSDPPKALTQEQLHAVIDYYVRGGNSKAILEDCDGFDGLRSFDIETALYNLAAEMDDQASRDELPPLVDGEEIKGAQWGVRFQKRGRDDNHICIQLLSEDDENWFESRGSSSSFWLQDLLGVLKRADEALRTRALADPDGYGYIFP